MLQHSRQLFVFLLWVGVTLTAGCGFHLRGMTPVPNSLQVIRVESSDPYGPVTRAVINELQSNGIKLVTNPQDKQDLPELRLLGSNLEENTVSIFRDGKTAESQLIFSLQAQILLPGYDVYPLRVVITRAFFDNPLTALAKDEERNIIILEMQQQAAQQLVRKLLTIHSDTSLKLHQQEKESEQNDSERISVKDSMSNKGKAPRDISDWIILQPEN